MLGCGAWTSPYRARGRGSFKDLDRGGMRAICIVDHCPGSRLAYGRGGPEGRGRGAQEGIGRSLPSGVEGDREEDQARSTADG